MLSASAKGNERIMYGTGSSAVRITWLLMMGSACSGAAIDFNSQAGGKGGGGSGAVGGDDTGGAKTSSGGMASTETGGRAAGVGTGGSAQGGNATAGATTGGSAGSSGGFGGGPPVIDRRCQIVSTQSAPDGSFVRQSYQSVRFDVATRVLTWEHSDEPFSTALSLRERRLVNDQGQLLVQTGEDFVNNSSWRFDDLRDSAGNLTESMATYTSDFDFSITPPPPHYSWAQYEHTYDASGLLVTTRTLGSVGADFALRNFVADAQGRCVKIERSGDQGSEVETRTYDGDRLVTSNIEGDAYQLVSEYRYDLQGRLVGYERDGAHGFRLDRADGVPNLTVAYEYADDGTVTVTSLDFDNDVSSDQRSVWQLSPGCSQIWAALPKSAEAECHFPDRAAVASVLDLVE